MKVPAELSRRQMWLLEKFIDSLGDECCETFDGCVLMFREGPLITTACYAIGEPAELRARMEKALVQSRALREMPPQGKVS